MTTRCVEEIYEKCSAADCATHFDPGALGTLVGDPSLSHTLELFDWPEPYESTQWTPARRYGDLLVGFYLSADYRPPPGQHLPLSVTLTLESTRMDEDAPVPVQSSVLRPGKVTFALEGRYLLPLVSLSYTAVSVRLSDPAASPHCHLVYAYLKYALRRECIDAYWTGTLLSGKPFYLGVAGMFGYDNTKFPFYRINPIQMRVFPMAVDVPAEKRKWHAKIDRELMAAAWHPKRMAYWSEEGVDDTAVDEE